MRNKLNEQLGRINRLMPKILIEDVAVADETINVDEAATAVSNTIFARAFEILESSIKGKNIDIAFERLLEKWGLIVRENETLAPKIVFDKVTKRISKINWDRFTPQDLENFFKLQPIREAFEEQFIKSNRINIEQFKTDQVARDFLKNVNLKFFTTVETYINQAANIIDSSAAKNMLHKTENYIKNLFSNVWYKGVTNWFNQNIGTKRIFQIFQTNLKDAESVKLREEGKQLLKEYNEYLYNEGGLKPIETSAYEQKILNYLIKLNTYTRKKSKVIWNEMMLNMPSEVRTQFFGTNSANGKVDPVFTLDKLADMIEYFQKMNPRIKAEWTGWFQGFGRMFRDLFSLSWSRKGTFAKRLLNMGLAFETRLSEELLNNVEVQGNSVARAFMKEATIRIGVMYFIYPAMVSIKEIAKLQYLQSYGHSPYFGMAGNEWYNFMITFEPEYKDDKKEWLKVGKEGAAKDIWWKLFQKYYGEKMKEQNWWNAFWHSPLYEIIMAKINNPKTSEDNEGATSTEAEQLQKEMILKYQKELRDKLYNDPIYKDIENKDSIFNVTMKALEDSINQSKADVKQIIDQGDVEVED